jgi:probable rRNA maturation factor
MTLTTDILISAPAWEKQTGLEDLTRRVVGQCLEICGLDLAPDCELSVNFCDDATIRALNAQWRGLDKATNVLSFPTPGALAAKPALGDIVVAYETVAREASEQNKPFLNHVAHMIIHGFLHLIGYDHETRLDADKMEAVERRIVSALGLPDPYEGTQPLEDGLEASEINCLHVDDE